MESNLPLPFVVDHQHLPLVCHVNPPSQLAERRIVLWLSSQLSLKYKWRHPNAPDLFHCGVPSQPWISNSPSDPKTIALC
ncbi:hypothetical protein KY284_023068 [Solanum tuberosum]|nr:hypothetical protein KY284_023068 [Solanum tuberosum]